jgi:hypothetical protein
MVAACIAGIVFCLRFLAAVQMERQLCRVCWVLCLSPKASYEFYDLPERPQAAGRRAA